MTALYSLYESGQKRDIGFTAKIVYYEEYPDLTLDSIYKMSRPNVHNVLIRWFITHMDWSSFLQTLKCQIKWNINFTCPELRKQYQIFRKEVCVIKNSSFTNFRLLGLTFHYIDIHFYGNSWPVFSGTLFFGDYFLKLP